MSIYSLNKVMLIGNLGIDPNLKQINSEKSVVTFSLATSESWLDKQSGQRTEKTEWHNIEIWSSKPDIYKNLKKGSKVYVEGRLQTQSYEKDGEKKYTTKIVADHLVFLDGKSNGDQSYSQPQTQSSGWSNANQSANQGGWGNSGGNQGGNQGGGQGGWGNSGGNQGGNQGGWGNSGGNQGGWSNSGGNQGGWGSSGNQGGNQGGWGSQGGNGWDNAKSSQAQPAWSSGFNEQALPPKSDDDEGDGNLPF